MLEGGIALSGGVVMRGEAAFERCLAWLRQR
jgi:hypothetical protein